MMTENKNEVTYVTAENWQWVTKTLRDRYESREYWTFVVMGIQGTLRFLEIEKELGIEDSCEKFFFFTESGEILVGTCPKGGRASFDEVSRVYRSHLSKEKDLLNIGTDTGVRSLRFSNWLFGSGGHFLVYPAQRKS